MTMHNDLYSQASIEARATAAVEIADLALAFGRIDRTGPCHPDGTPESDSDHTVMLGWLAPALAELVNERMTFAHYNVDRVATFALVHDAAEVYAGDTCTVKITEGELAAKADREAVATATLFGQFKTTLPWFANRVLEYESQKSREARFVRAVDKVLPKMVHLVDNRIGLKKLGITRSDLIELFQRQRKQVKENITAGAHLVLGMYDVLCNRVLAEWEEPSPVLVQPNGDKHVLRISMHGTSLHHVVCSHDANPTCPYSLGYNEWFMNEWPNWLSFLSGGEYELALDGRGALVLKEN